jgi:hypothetical protein
MSEVIKVRILPKNAAYFAAFLTVGVVLLAGCSLDTLYEQSIKADLEKHDVLESLEGCVIKRVTQTDARTYFELDDGRMVVFDVDPVNVNLRKAVEKIDEPK